MRRALLVLSLVLGAGAAARAAGPRCLHFAQTNDPAARAMTLRIDNDCDEEMACWISWKITCVSAGARTTTAHDERALLPARGGQSWAASAATCAPGDGYEIGAPTWSCRPPSADRARR
jgi:hypothetical protein